MQRERRESWGESGIRIYVCILYKMEHMSFPRYTLMPPSAIAQNISRACTYTQIHPWMLSAQVILIYSAGKDGRVCLCLRIRKSKGRKRAPLLTTDIRMRHALIFSSIDFLRLLLPASPVPSYGAVTYRHIHIAPAHWRQWRRRRQYKYVLEKRKERPDSPTTTTLKGQRDSYAPAYIPAPIHFLAYLSHTKPGLA